MTVVGVHLHWPMGARNSAQRNAALRALAELAQATPGPLLIGGDFNITPWSPVFDAALRASTLADCARGQGLLTRPTFFLPAAIRIDHCLASAHWRVLRVTCRRWPDHRPMLNDLERRHEPRMAPDRHGAAGTGGMLASGCATSQPCSCARRPGAGRRRLPFRNLPNPTRGHRRVRGHLTRFVFAQKEGTVPSTRSRCVRWTVPGWRRWTRPPTT